MDENCKQNILSKVFIISPSGNLYGSEKVLLDYLSFTKNQYEVAVPVNSVFAGVVKSMKARHHFVFYDNKKLKRFYFRLLLQLVSNKFDIVYLNEAGHCKYLMFISKLVFWKKYVIHVRLLSDTEVGRWSFFNRANTRIIATSQSVSAKLKHSNILLYDLFKFSGNKKKESEVCIVNTLRIGIIGRVSLTKGMEELAKLLDYMEKKRTGDDFEITLYGDITSEMSGHPVLNRIKQCSFVKFKGFFKDQNEMFKNIDLVLHLCKEEALGRVFLEAVEYGKPFIGFNAGGIGEIGKLTELTDLLCESTSDNFQEEMFRKIQSVRNNYSLFADKVNDRRKLALEIFNEEFYTNKLDAILTE